MGFLKILFFVLLLYVKFKIILNYDENSKLFPIRDYVLTSTYLNNFDLNSTKSKRSIIKCHYINLKTSNDSYNLCLQVKSTPDTIMSKNATILVYNNTSEEYFNVDDLNILFVRGYASSHPYTSIVTGYIENSEFYGRLYVDDKIFYVEQVKYFRNFIDKKKLKGSSKNAIVYEGTDTNLVVNVLFKNDSFKVYNRSILLKIQNLNKYNTKPKGYICNLLAIIDTSFLKYVTFNNIQVALRTVIDSIQNAESIYRSTDFDEDGIPDNIGIKLHTVIVAGTKGDMEVEDYLQSYRDEPMDGRIYLNRLSKFPQLKNHCLGIAFTAQPFLNRVIGLSFTAVVEFTEKFILTSGGICDTPNVFGECHNTLVVTYSLESGLRAPQFLADISLSHELGHSFGSDHDNEDICSGHIMASHTFKASAMKSLSFSQCSKRQIMKVLRIRSTCFEPTDEPFCGNGIVELGEDCDCGHPMNCKELDQCCIPKGAKGQECTVNQELGFECHPAQGLCCQNNCMYRNISHVGLNCKGIHFKCPCRNHQTRCNCGLLGGCLGDECHSNECLRIGMKECPCPKQVKNCQTCCLTKSSVCEPAVNITTETLAGDQALFRTLLATYNIEDLNFATRNDVLQILCDDKTCIKILFKMFNNDDVCLYRGQLGICQKNKCQLPNLLNKNIYPILSKPVKVFKNMGVRLFPATFKINLKMVVCLLFYTLFIL